ncbi:FAD-dependent oxidoreductase [Sphaerotilus sp.]|uniref:FAD-dependent oxidoreductase n=1 Tax=Sphaerotilus sp. TaxID=2093942 RepID=UPI002ACDDDCF|nr:FAD-dependent oxidoreductase [Sphaerotilus sp.]MDZ7858803.1 FAD-dependent oxidoreductase [Sphaerotilus sp.]
MLSTYTYPRYAYRRPAELDTPDTVTRHPVVVVGAGPVGLSAAIDLAQQGLPVVLLDDDDTVSVGSRGLCYAKRTLEVLDRLGCGQPVVDKGVTWNVGRTFHREAEVFSFNLLPEPDHRRPGMVNLQQYYLEEYLVHRAAELPNLDLRWKNKVAQVTPITQDSEGALIEVETADGTYRLRADWLVVADGARSPIRRQLGLDIEGKVFQDRFLIADVVMKADFPAERWFWFDPPFHPNQSVLLHREADNVWRIDFQLGWDADPEHEKKPEQVIPRIRAMLGPDRDFALEWVSVYTFQCRRMHRFRHGRILFVGDAAHQVSPFGARGANSGIQDADNLAWKLKLVLDGRAPESLMDSYSDERVEAAEENLLNSTRSTDFITPKSQVSRDFRNAVLTLAGEHAFARALVNSGRLSVPTHHRGSPLSTPDTDGDTFTGPMTPGAPMDDAPVTLTGAGAGVKDDWLLAHTGNAFVLLRFGHAEPSAFAALADDTVPVRTLDLPADGIAARRYDAQPGTAYLIRPDQVIAARWRAPTLEAVRAAVRRATGHACNA